MRYFILFIFLTISLSINAQQHIIDSLQILSNAPGISNVQRVMYLADLGAAFKYQNFAEAVRIGNKVIEMGNRLMDNQALSYAWSAFYRTCLNRDSITGMKEAKDSALWYAGKCTNKDIQGIAYYTAGDYAIYNNEDVNAVNFFLQALMLFQQTNNTTYIIKVCTQLSLIYQKREASDDAEKYVRLAFNTAQTRKTPENLLQSYKNIAQFFIYKLNYECERQYPPLCNLYKDTALYYSKKALALFELNKNVMEDQIVGLNVKLLYAIALSRFPNAPFDSLITVSKQVVDEAQKLNSDFDVARAYNLTGALYLYQKKNEEAKTAFLQAYSIVKKMKKPGYNLLCDILYNLTTIADEEGDKSNLIKFGRELISQYVLLRKGQLLSSLKNQEANVVFQKKEQEILQWQTQALFSKKINLFSIGIAVLSLLTLGLLFISYRLKLKLASQQKQLLEALAHDAIQQQKLMEVRAHDAILQSKLKAEEARRLELEQQLMQQKNEQLQKEVFAGAIQLKQKNELLENLRQEISQIPAASKIDKIIKEGQQADDHFEEYKSLIKSAHPNFFTHLQEQANGKLTELDIKYCAFIYLKMPTKQMASLLHVEANTIHTTKYRLKTKLKLSKEEDLDSFIQSK